MRCYGDRWLGDSEIYISGIAQSLSWTACKELQISELSASEGLVFGFGELP
jgi:hypothetical protein